MSKDIVDLVPSEDGSYAPKTSVSRAISTEVKPKAKTKKKYDRKKADDFLSGLDAGLTFLEEVSPMVSRFMKLKRG